MTHSDKILRALESAIKHLDDSISALEGMDEDAFSNYIWHAAAELEYALFLFSLVIKDEHSVPPTKINPKPKSLQMSQTMLKVKELISEARASIRNGDFINACRNARLARLCIFEVQESLTRKKYRTRKEKG